MLRKTLIKMVVIVATLVFLLILFWVETLYSLWASLFTQPENQVIPFGRGSRDPYPLLAFTILFTVVVVAVGIPWARRRRLREKPHGLPEFFRSEFPSQIPDIPLI